MPSRTARLADARGPDLRLNGRRGLPLGERPDGSRRGLVSDSIAGKCPDLREYNHASNSHWLAGPDPPRPVRRLGPGPGAAGAGRSPRAKKKDTNPRLKSRNAELTASVEPAEAKPGDTVTLKVTAKLDPGYHIYKYSKTPMKPGEGPSYTSFDLFDPAGLEAQGDWSASKEPIQHKEEVWPNLPFVEYYEDEVTWSHKLKVPPGTPAGKKTLRVQVGYMICDARSCSPPGQWTLPAVTLTVRPGEGAGASSSPAAKPAASDPETTSSNDSGKAAATSEAPKAPPAAASPAPKAVENSPGDVPVHGRWLAADRFLIGGQERGRADRPSRA